MKFLSGGHLSQRACDLLGALGCLILFVTAFLFDEWSGFLFWTCALAGGMLGYMGAYGGLAKKFGLQPPFTNDPLGWRNAKKSYEIESDVPHGNMPDRDGIDDK
jgi:hypothetical protein